MNNKNGTNYNNKDKILRRFYGTGRRKSASARVFLVLGKGNILVNKRNLDQYFYVNRAQEIVKRPLRETNLLGMLDAFITVKGGGVSGQAGAVAHGVARALLRYDVNLRNMLRPTGLITRDSREVERKKVGLRKSRKCPQFSKR